MEYDKIGSFSKFGPKYEFCPDADWWKQGVSYADHQTEWKSLPSPSPLEREFNERAERWERETGIHSSPVIRFMHKDYQSIMAKGMQVIPLILERMKKNPDDWFWALRYITGEDPASSEDGFDGAVRAWLKWGEDNGYIAK